MTNEVPRIVALGGGTGLPSVLAGLASQVGPWLEGLPERLTAIVTVADDGGSSGRLRRGRGVLPPGDVRNCLVALGRDPHSLGELFQYRYRGDHTREDGLGGHTLGNLILTALAEQTGCFLTAIERASRVLAVRGRILPSTLEDVSLVAEMADGSVVRGESAIAGDRRAISRVFLDPGEPEATPGALEAIGKADLVVLAPGSLFTSLVPNLLVGGVAEAIRKTQAVKVLVGNLMTQVGETEGFDGGAHLAPLEEQLGPGVLDLVLVPEETPDSEVLDRYAREGQVPVDWREEVVERHGASLVRRSLLARTWKVRHDPSALAASLLDLARAPRLRRARIV